MKAYQHTQPGRFILIAMATGAAVAAMSGLAFKPAFLVVGILLVCGWLFHSLTIEIADGELRWRFGPGIIGQRVPMEMIVSAKTVRTNVVEGWGIRLSRFGWLYNVSGLDAVAITMKNGQHFALGTDEPQALCAVLNAGCSTPLPGGIPAT